VIFTYVIKEESSFAGWEEPVLDEGEITLPFVPPLGYKLLVKGEKYRIGEAVIDTGKETAQITLTLYKEY